MWTAVGHRIRRTSRLDNVLLYNAGNRATFSNEMVQMDSKIFNRADEIATFERVLKSKPQFSLVTGPLHSGKSTLLMEVLDRIQFYGSTLGTAPLEMSNHSLLQ